ncbi:MAG: ChbG/HpnK family deacetylase [Proteobacteria bacterium]|nr:ChbG/HpnK family deacetylase [Pseudomonadota bacterium]
MNTSQGGLILCADDYALHPLVDEAVLRLADAGRLSATSCMTTAPRWRAAAPQLKALRPRLQVGLHFNLTEGHGGAHGARTLGRVLAAAYARRLSATELRDAWRAQLDAFEDAMGAAPDYVDGHQHVHQLPGVRQAMLAELQARYAGRAMPWVRSTVPAGRLWRDPKAAVIALLGGWSCTQLLARAGLPMNRGFGGVYGFDAPDATAYGAHMRAWLAQMGEGGLLMCHPAAAEVPGDAIGRQRPVEFAYLMSDAFAQDLRQRGCRLLQKQ